MEAVPGYLSLHQNADIMTLKWTPNQLMNGSVGDLDYERRCELIPLQMNCRRGDRVCLQSPASDNNQQSLSDNLTFILPSQGQANALHHFISFVFFVFSSAVCLKTRLLLNNAACLRVAQGLSVQPV